MLHRHARALADAAEDRVGDRVGGVFLVGGMLDYDAAVHEGAVLRVVGFGMVRMHGVRVVGRNHEAGGHGGARLRVGRAERGGDAVEYVAKERRICPLLRAGANLFVVEHGENLRVRLRRGFEERAKRRVRAFQIVNAAAGEILVIRAPDAAGHAVIQEQVACDDLLGLCAAAGGDFLREPAAGRFVAVERDHVDLRVEVVAGIDIAVEMNGHVWDERRVAAEIDEPRMQARFILDDGAPGDGKRPVQPGGHDHAAVALDVEAHVFAARFIFGEGLEFESRGIAVAGDDLERREAAFRHAQRKQRRAVAGQIIPAARRELPRFAFVQPGEARFFQHFGHFANRVKRRRRAADKIDEISRLIAHGIKPSLWYRSGSIIAVYGFASKIVRGETTIFVPGKSAASEASV